MPLREHLKQPATLYKALRWIKNWMAPVADPLYSLRGLQNYRWYFTDWWRYARMPLAEPIHWIDTYPQLHDRTSTTSIDAHYFYTNGWAMRRIVATAPRYHVDVASQTMFANLLGAVTPVIFVDYRPLVAQSTGLQSLGASLFALPFPDRSIHSLSCLHVLDNVGLGRYGDPLDPQGTSNAVTEMVRVLATGGNLFLSTPVGRPRLCFNAHRIHAAAAIREMASELELVEFSGVTDAGQYVERVDLNFFKESDYACGFFWLQR